MSTATDVERARPQPDHTAAPWDVREEILRENNLFRAFERVRDNDYADGDPRPGLLRFERSVATRLGEIRNALAAGAYRPAPLTAIDLPKADGTTRRLRVPVVADRVVERAIAQVLARRVDAALSPWSFAFRPGLGVDDALAALAAQRDAGLGWVVRGDFRDCFDSLPPLRVAAALRAQVPDPWLLELVGRLLGRRARRPGNRWWLAPHGVAQGSPLSPLLANLYLDHFDDQLFLEGFPAIRFADDFAIPCRTEAEAQRALEIAQRAARDLGLTFNDAKTMITTFDEGSPFLGADCTPAEPLSDTNPVVSPPTQKVLYVATQGAGIQVRSGQIRVVRNDTVMLAVPITQVSRIVTFGSVGISAGLRDQAFRNQIEVTLCSRSGSYQGRLDTPSRRRIELRRTQYRCFDALDFRLRIARSIVAAKLANQRALLVRYGRRARGPELVEATRRLADLRRQALEATTLNRLRGFEGIGARIYFSLWPILLPDGAGFAGRNRRPPKDPVNAALSLGYSILTGMTVAACSAAGLDGDLGFLHEPADRRPSLALDLMEEFRPLIVDTTVLDCWRRRILTTDACTVTSGGGVRLPDQERRAFLGRLEERMLTVFAHVPSGQRVSYRRGLFLQARQLADLCTGARDRYEPVGWR